LVLYNYNTKLLHCQVKNPIFSKSFLFPFSRFFAGYCIFMKFVL
jgi:hypothetical protein